MKTNYFVDPHREIPDSACCYSQPCPNPSEHPGWRHAKSWTEVQEHLDAGAEVRDRDGDLVIKVIAERSFVVLENNHEYGYAPAQILLEDIEIVAPATQEEEDEALASIMESFGNRRLASPGDPLS